MLKIKTEKTKTKCFSCRTLLMIVPRRLLNAAFRTISWTIELGEKAREAKINKLYGQQTQTILMRKKTSLLPELTEVLIPQQPTDQSCNS